MDCRECQDKLSLYLDGQLTDGERLRVEAEIEACSDCAQAFEALSLLVTDLNDLGPAPVPATLLDDLKAAFRSELQAATVVEESTPRRSFYSYFGPWRAAAAVVVGLLTVFVVAEDRGFIGAPAPANQEYAARDHKLKSPGAEQLDDFEAKAALDQKSMAPAEANEVQDEQDAVANLDLDAEEAAEERLIGSWGGFVGRLQDSVEKRGMKPVESSAATEGFLAGAAPRAEAEGLKEAAKSKDGVRNRSRGQPKRVATPTKGEASAPTKGETMAPKKAPISEPRAQSYIVLGENSAAKVRDLAEKRGLKLVFQPLKELGDDQAEAPEAAALEAELKLSPAAVRAFLNHLKTNAGLTLRLFAESQKPAEDDADGASAAQILHLILPRP